MADDVILNKNAIIEQHLDEFLHYSQILLKLAE